MVGPSLEPHSGKHQHFETNIISDASKREIRDDSVACKAALDLAGHAKFKARPIPASVPLGSPKPVIHSDEIKLTRSA